jgi:hypothetical protein
VQLRARQSGRDPIEEERMVIAHGLRIPRTANPKLRSTGRLQAATRTPARRRGARGAIGRGIDVPGIVRDIRVKIASEAGEWEQAFRLVAANYRARGYDAPGSFPYRFTPHHALPESVTLVAKHGHRVVATLSLIRDTPLLGLPLEDIYSAEVAQLRGQGRCLAEFTSLANTGLSLGEFVRVFRTMIKLAMQYHVSREGDSWVIAVHPRHRDYYRKAIGFVPVGTRRAYPTVQGQPAEAYMVDVEGMKRNAPQTYLEMFGEPLPGHVLATPGWSPERVLYFGSQSSQTDRGTIEEILRVVEQSGSLYQR